MTTFTIGLILVIVGVGVIALGIWTPKWLEELAKGANHRNR